MDDQLYNYKAKITDVYDGDSVTIDIDLGFKSWLLGQKLRLFGIDTPEIRGDERPEGLIAKDRLEELVLGKEVIITSYKDRTGKYGRWLATIYLKEEDGTWTNINQLLVDEGLVEIYE